MVSGHRAQLQRVRHRYMYTRRSPSSVSLLRKQQTSSITNPGRPALMTAWGAIRHSIFTRIHIQMGRERESPRNALGLYLQACLVNREDKPPVRKSRFLASLRARCSAVSRFGRRLFVFWLPSYIVGSRAAEALISAVSVWPRTTPSRMPFSEDVTHFPCR